MKKWSWKKKIAAMLIAALLIIQFIRPARNKGEAYGPNDYTYSLAVSSDVKQILETSCYDCHSNNTNHMWYENIQPVGWWIGNHIKEGKVELNFSEFASYPDKKKAHKLEEIAELVEEGEMPLKSYLWIHGNARLSDEQKRKVIDWALNEMKKFESQAEREKHEHESH